MYSLMGAILAFLIVVLAVDQDLPEWLRWVSLGLALAILMIMVSAIGFSRAELVGSRDKRGRISGILGVSTDVTAVQKETREVVLGPEQRMQEIVDNNPQPMYAKSVNGQFLVVNRRYEELFRFVSEDLVGRSHFKVIGGEQTVGPLREKEKLVLERGTPIQFYESVNFPDGEHFYVSMRFPMRDPEGEIFAVGGIFTDITERKKAEQGMQNLNIELMEAYDNLTKAHEQLIHAEKMESVGRLAAGVAHEVNNPLAMISMGLELLARRLPEDDEQGKETIARMKRGIDRAKKIVRGLVDYSSNRRLECLPIATDSLVGEALELVEYQFKKAGIKIDFVPDPTLPRVDVDQTMVEQVLVNLFFNAMHAMEKGGTLKIRTEMLSIGNVPFDKGSRLRERLYEGDKVVKITVEDTGSGIPDDVMGKLFEPFFTTKATGKGTGLGLTVARKIAELHGGNLVLANRKDGNGSIATLTLKVAEN